jgi:DNA-binding SARP family transcriptional activator
MSILSLRLMGSFDACIDNYPLEGLGRNKAAALLAYLAFERQTSHQRNILAALLWPEATDAQGRNNLRQILFRLQDELSVADSPPFLLMDRQTVRLNPASVINVDALEFLSLVQSCQGHRHQLIERCDACIQRLERAIRLYQGHFLQGLLVSGCTEFDMWVEIKQEWLRHQAIGILYYLTSYYEYQGDFRRAYEYAFRQLEMDPLHEEAHREIMRLRFRMGQRSAALEHYTACKELLALELGVEPEEETTHLYQQIKEGFVPGHLNGILLPVELPDSRTSHLPFSLMPRFGYSAEIETITMRLLDPSSRLVTILGLGGMGKSRIAFEAAQAAAYAFTDDVHFINLSETAPAPVHAESAEAGLIHILVEHFQLDPAPEGAQRAALLRAIKSCNQLLVLDNFEYFLAARGLLLDLLYAAPKLTILVTSRQRLHLRGEVVIWLHGLSYETTSSTSESVQLLEERAQRVCADFTLSEASQADADQLCQLLGGWPLAIELAAAQLDHYSIVQIVDAIEKNLAFLSSDSLGISEHHRSLYSILNSGWEELSPEDRGILDCLSSFPAAFDDIQVYSELSVQPAVLHRLIEASLLRRLGPSTYNIPAPVCLYLAQRHSS